jgi:pantetheine-phosphate adenylyltransferase
MKKQYDNLKELDYRHFHRFAQLMDTDLKDLSYIFQLYNEEHRYYHTLEHINYMLNKAEENYELSDDLLIAIIFHDVIYDPKSTNNELESAKLFKKYSRNKIKNEDLIYQAILDTKNHIPTEGNNISKLLIKYDLEILFCDFDELIEFERKIFKEYQFVDYSIYKEKRIEVLTKLAKQYYIDNLCHLINYVKTYKPNIAVYPGSFNPMHLGHLNILEKAEKIFDKVIIARGINPDKINNKVLPLPDSLKYRQIDTYDSLLTDYINTKQYDLTVIRGLRNSIDLQSEITMYRYLQDLKPEIKLISIFCDSKFEHISSSAIRGLEKANSDVKKYLI